MQTQDWQGGGVMLIEIKNKHTNKTIYSTEAETLKDAVIGAIKSNAELSNADLRYADLSNANLSNANLRYADLRYADLSNADLSNANLRYADLSNADLSNANLRYADLSNANLRYADLSNANLSNANLSEALGNMNQIKSAQFDKWQIVWTKEIMAIGCQQHAIAEWWFFDDEKINSMSRDALAWWSKWKTLIKQMVELSLC